MAKEEKVTYMTPKEFYEKGYLQELNRQFLHPLGLALEVNVDEKTGDVSFGRVWVAPKNDKVGFVFGIQGMEKAGSEQFWEFMEKMQFVQSEANKRSAARKEAFGSKSNIEDVAKPKTSQFGL